ncbi:hypothetical protein DOY81_011992 [Sarcophaga bullata]|nr:hypothetical protein DOY81_011992 [Sarcophaga bullata]
MSSQEICQSFTTCNGHNSTLEMFSCHGQIGANNTKAVYSISGNASEHATLMREKYRTINVRHENCSMVCERTYIESTASTYRKLQSCLGGHTKPLDPSSTTTTPLPTTVITSPSLPVSSTTEVEAPAGTSEVNPTELPVVTEPTVLPDTEEFAKLLKLFK